MYYQKYHFIAPSSYFPVKEDAKSWGKDFLVLAVVQSSKKTDEGPSSSKLD